MPTMIPTNPTLFLSYEELLARLEKIRQVMEQNDLEALLLRSIPSHLYLTGSVFSGFSFIPRKGLPLFFPDRATTLFEGYPSERVLPIRKPEQIPDLLGTLGFALSERTALELSFLPHAEYLRLTALFPSGTSSPLDASLLMRQVRSIKTPYEVDIIRAAARVHQDLYRDAPSLFREGMSDLEWQIEIEHEMRLRGSIGVFRCFGPRMEIFMGNVSVGENALRAAPYDFTMGGVGFPAMPMGACGEIIRQGKSVMLDMAGNFSPYNTDISRVYTLGGLPSEALELHALSVRMHDYFRSAVRPGVEISSVYGHCLSMLEEVPQASSYFMGGELKARYVGHGLGIEINEPPVLTQRATGTFQEGMTLAFEPKFVLPGVGPLGVENTYLVTSQGVENLTPLPEEILPLSPSSSSDKVE